MKQQEDILEQLNKKIKEDDKIYPIHRLGLLTTGGDGQKTIYNKCTENVFRILQNCPDFTGKFRYDEWTQKKEILKDGKWVEVDDNDYTPVQRKIQAMYAPFRTVSKDMVIDAINDACQDNKCDSAKDYLNSLAWDKNPRLDCWVHTVYGTEFDEYHQAVGANFFKGLVKRIIDPGCKLDTMMIVEGGQGCGKSTSFQIIGGAWYAETINKVDDKDFLLLMNGKLLIDLSEGFSFKKADQLILKAILSTPCDTYRAPYGRETKNIPRRCAFIMSTNQDNYLGDTTGNRRFYPIVIPRNKKVDTKWLKDNRDQLFAEALYRVEVLKETIYEYPDCAVDHQNEKMERNPYEDKIIDWIENPTKNTKVFDVSDGLTMDDIWEYAICKDNSKIWKGDEMQIASVLTQLGWEKVRVMRKGARRMRWYKNGKVGTEQLL